MLGNCWFNSCEIYSALHSNFCWQKSCSSFDVCGTSSQAIFLGTNLKTKKSWAHLHRQGHCWVFRKQGTSLSHGEGDGTPLQHSCLENPMDRGAWWAAVHGVTKSRTPLSDFTFTFHFHALKKEMAIHSSVLAWRIPGTGAWWAAIYGVAQSWTQLNRLSSSSSSLSQGRRGRFCWLRRLKAPTFIRTYLSVLRISCSCQALILSAHCPTPFMGILAKL